MRAVETAVADRKVLELDYVDRSGQRTERRRVEPYGLAGSQDHWYLMAWCRLRGGGRSFRLDRMQGARVTDERAPERELHEVAGGSTAHTSRAATTARAATTMTMSEERRACLRNGLKPTALR